MARLFNSVSIPLKRRNKFDLSFPSRLTTEFGRLTPIMCEPVLPNDRFQISTALRVQFAPMKFPVMQKFSAYVHYFFVPNRLLWDKWEEFITGGEDGLQEPSYPVIKLDADLADSAASINPDKTNFGVGSLYDYLGFPTFGSSDYLDDVAVYEHEFDALPYKAYQLIYNEWYRDQNISDPVDIHPEISGVQDNDDDGAFVWDLLTTRQRAWRKDYFTSALPDPQRGPDVTLPIVGDMSISGEGTSGLTVAGWQDANDNNRVIAMRRTVLTDYNSSDPVKGISVPNSETPGDPVVLVGSVNNDTIASKLSVDSDGVRSATINEVRRAFAVQRWYELAARAGSRYVEQILAHFGIRSSDARLQRPEYIGGGVIPVMIGDVLQTSETDGTPLGTPAGVGQAAGVAKLKKRAITFEEHGWIIGILSIIPEAAYPQGMPRKFLKRDKFDFAWPLLANLGEQEIEKQELFFEPGKSTSYNKEGFGYAPRYSEYKFGYGQVHGDFRSSLRDFHDARFFDSRPRLNDEFIEVRAAGNYGLNRIFAVTSGSYDHLWVNLYNNIKVRRVLPKYGTPI